MTTKLAVKSIILEYGTSVRWFHAIGATVNLDSGDKKSFHKGRLVRKALILQEEITEKFTYDLSYIAANKNFIQGGFYAQGKRAVMILKINLSTHSMNDQVDIDGTRYRISKVFDNPNGAWGFNLTDIKDA